MGLDPTDPMSAAVDRWRATSLAHEAAHRLIERNLPEAWLRGEPLLQETTNAWLDALTALYRTEPTSLAGIVAFAAILVREESNDLRDWGQAGEAVLMLCGSIERVLGSAQASKPAAHGGRPPVKGSAGLSRRGKEPGRRGQAKKPPPVR